MPISKESKQILTAKIAQLDQQIADLDKILNPQMKQREALTASIKKLQDERGAAVDLKKKIKADAEA